jgi:hypothetical protein
MGPSIYGLIAWPLLTVASAMDSLRISQVSGLVKTKPQNAEKEM